jgi:5,10-methylenetetrahydrofolate reductase
MAAPGMRHVVPLTGDPAKAGDHPGAASVYDVNSVELISIIKRLNEGFTQAGKSIKMPTGFAIGSTLRGAFEAMNVWRWSKFAAQLWSSSAG